MRWAKDEMGGHGERLLEPEILGTLPPEVAELNLRDLTRLNKWFGGHRIIRALIGRIFLPHERFTVLDVGSGFGDMTGSVLSRFPQAAAVSADYNHFHVSSAPGSRVVADAHHLPFAPGSFDIVFCSLFLHHFSDEEIVRLLRSFRVLARRAVVAVDLLRSPVAYHFLPLTRRLLGWDPVTVRDGCISVRAGFRARELACLARNAGLDAAEVRLHHPWFRVSLVAHSTPVGRGD